MRISFLLLSVLILLGTLKAFEIKSKNKNKPITKKQIKVDNIFKQLNQEEGDLDSIISQAQDRNDIHCYKDSLKSAASLKTKYFKKLQQSRKLVDRIVKGVKNAKVEVDEADDLENLNQAEGIIKIARDLVYESETVNDNLKLSEKYRVKQKNIIKAKKKVIKNEAISLAKTEKWQRALKGYNYVAACIRAATNATPPEFCWKQGGDAGVIPTGCPQGFERKLALCYRKCPAGYFHRLGICHKECQPGFTDLGLICFKWWFPNLKWRHVFIPTILTNFSSQVPCPEGRYKGGALCYRDCGLIGMHNCGIGACSRSGGSCAANIVNMVFQSIQGVIEAIGFVLSFGGTAAISMAAKTLNKVASKIGKATLKSLARGVRNWFRSISVKKLTQITARRVKLEIKKKIPGVIFDLSINSMISGICSNVSRITLQTYQQDSVSDFDFSKLDPTGIKTAHDYCKDDSGSKKCQRGIVEAVSLIDPTGLTTIASAFIHKTCEGV